MSGFFFCIYLLIVIFIRNACLRNLTLFSTFARDQNFSPDSSPR